MKSARWSSLHAESIIIDGLNISRWCEATLQELAQGGVTAVNATIAVHEGFRQTIERIADWQELLVQCDHLALPVRSVADIQRAKDMGKVGIIFGFQNSDPLEGDLRLLSVFRGLGLRVIQLTYNERNYAGDGCLERTDGGLSRFGLDLVGEMNRLGILVDLSHVGYRTTMEAIEASVQPVAFTHANPRALRDHPRNKTDEQIKALVRKGGVIGANVFPEFLPSAARSTLAELIDVVDYLVRLAGIEHVGIGTDFTSGQSREWFDWLLAGRSGRDVTMEVAWPVEFPRGIRTAADMPNVTRALLDRGYSEADTQNIMGGNFLRLYEQVWQ